MHLDASPAHPHHHIPNHPNYNPKELQSNYHETSATTNPPRHESLTVLQASFPQSLFGGLRNTQPARPTISPQAAHSAMACQTFPLHSHQDRDSASYLGA